MNKKYMKELEGIHKEVIEAKKTPGHIGDQIWKLIIAMEYLVTTLMEKERNPQDVMVEKVLIHGDDPSEVHMVMGDFLNAIETVCGERLHPISCIHITNNKIPVTCEKCKRTASAPFFFLNKNKAV